MAVSKMFPPCSMTFLRKRFQHGNGFSISTGLSMLSCQVNGLTLDYSGPPNYDSEFSRFTSLAIAEIGLKSRGNVSRDFSTTTARALIGREVCASSARIMLPDKGLRWTVPTPNFSASSYWSDIRLRSELRVLFCTATLRLPLRAGSSVQ